MKIPIRITFQDMPISDAIESACWQEAGKLERDFDGIMSCHVTVAGPHRHRQPLGPIRITVLVPGSELVADREPRPHQEGDDIELAIRDAFDRMRRQLQEHAANQDK